MRIYNGSFSETTTEGFTKITKTYYAALTDDLDEIPVVLYEEERETTSIRMKLENKNSEYSKTISVNGVEYPVVVY